ncbi:unnamed protein product [Boreogadus saida]
MLRHFPYTLWQRRHNLDLCSLWGWKAEHNSQTLPVKPLIARMSETHGKRWNVTESTDAPVGITLCYSSLINQNQSGKGQKKIPLNTKSPIKQLRLYEEEAYHLE